MAHRSEIGKFYLSLQNHPGVGVATVLTIAGGVAGLQRDNWLLGAIVGSAVMGACCWIPVLLTAWEQRKDYDK